MFNINEIKIGKIIEVSDDPYIVIKTDHHKMGRGGAVLKVKLKNLINGSALEKTFQGNEKAKPAETEKRKANFMYKDENNVYFMDNDSYEEVSLEISQIGDKQRFLKEGLEITGLYFKNNIVSIDLPVKIKFKVISAPPGIKGNSVGNVLKQVEIETGAKINVPLFINEGDEIIINTEKGEYAERA